ncbi:C13 family peptidase [Noviherbaspirillum sedimenti]|uniref:C13 family peptidase n=1 Tax=Noviherbaspirillum sedimenti TaxID=2320865 RepID=UPI0018F7BD87|nr:C13 family peptidase [Noviherbaspirillum sedimenti]
MNTIARRMDREKDILFLFLTSHGSKKHELTLNQNGIELRDLEAKELGKLLKESGIRWKVVLVSACYAGGFIDPLKDEHTMVIAAARHDRTSFGCSDENDFTYFGKAFFQESLPGARSFGEAFRTARTLVAQWEAKDFNKVEGGKDDEQMHSEPQIHHPGLIEQYLDRWRAQLVTPRPGMAGPMSKSVSDEK